MRKLRDRIAVITGAAGGIGRATALALAKEGCDVAVSDVNLDGAEETAQLVRALGRNATAHQVDVSDKGAMERFADAVVAAHGAVHLVMNNAGVTVTSRFEDHSLEDFEWIVGINFWGVVYGCKYFLPHLKQQDEGHIVNISSVFGLAGIPMQSSYCATKFAVRGFSESLWVELRDHNIGVTTVHPGGVNTNIANSARAARAADKSRAVKSLATVGVPPEAVADKIVEAIKDNRQRLLVARGALFFEAAKRLSPTASQYLVHYSYKRSG